jgi:putative DNA primase/helicase
MTSAHQIAQALGGRRHGYQYRCRCPAHDDHDPSLDVRDTVGGVLVNCKAGCSQASVIQALGAMGLWAGRQFGAVETDQERDRRIEAQARERDHENARRTAWALQLWESAYSPYLSPASFYIKRRGLALPQHAEEVIRFLPECPRGKERIPALIALMRDVVSGEPTAIQRIYIRPDLTKDKCEASPNGTKTLGRMRGSAIMLTSFADTFCDGQEFADPLYVAEGLETALGVMCLGYAPVWALCSTGNIANLPVHNAVSHLVICADNDVPKERNGVVKTPGLDAARECRARWHEGGKACTIWMPNGEGKDFADVA